MPVHKVGSVIGPWQWLQNQEGQSYFFNSDTKEATERKPDCFMTSLEKEQSTGEYVWCPHETEAYLPGRVQSRAGGIASVELVFEDGHRERANVPEGSCTSIESMVAVSNQVDDLVQLAEVNDPSIVHLLRARFMQDKIYTWVGNILVAVNPFKQLDLYTPTIIEKIQNRGPVEAKPHTYVIADVAYQNMRRFRFGQSILISGESGAGKTETTKHALTYLSEVAGGALGVDQKVLSANPILEAFGNAKTLRNNNSSRFGKLMSLAFDKKSFEICGCSIENYLLEKSRVIYQSPNERNYHIFYMLCKSHECQQDFSLEAADEFHYLNTSGCLTIDGLDDAEELKTMVAAMNGVGFTEEERRGIFSVVSGILHLGNIEFKAQDGSNAEGSCLTERSKFSLGQAARLLEVDEELLGASLTELHYTIRGESVQVLLNPEKAADARDALSKALYGCQFDWLVKRANDAIRPPMSDLGSTIGILDIFGFEIFQKNSFEQLCINFANEQLQQHFNHNTFKLEEELYRSEAVPFEPSNYIDNQAILDLIEKKPDGMLVMLDEELKMPKASDETFLSKLKRKHGTNANFDDRRKGLDKSQFILKHYAGEVTYEVSGFLDKNKDRLYDDLEACITSSNSSYVVNLFEGTSDNKRETQGGRFKRQLTSLMSSLAATEPQYIRCIKANSSKKAGIFEAPLCLQQLRYSGVFEAVTIRKQGFPFRLTHEQWFKEYRALEPDACPGGAIQTNYKASCETLLSAIDKGPIPGIIVDGTYIGTTRVLYRANIHRKLTLYRNLAYEKTICIVQRYSRGLCGRRRYREMKRVALLLENAVAQRDEQALSEAIGQHFVQKRLGWVGLWVVLPHRYLTNAKIVQASVQAEKLMRTKISVPASEVHREALEEWKSMVATMDTHQRDDPKAFSADEFTTTRQGKRVLDAAALNLRKILGAPLVDRHEEAMVEYKDMRAMVESCRVLQPTALDSSEFAGLLLGDRVVGSAAAFLDRLSDSPILEDPKAALDEYAKMKAVVDDCVLLDASALSSDKYAALRKGSRVVVTATAAVERMIGKPIKEDFDDALAEHEEIMSLIKPCIEIDAGSFADDKYLALRKGSRVIASAMKTVDSIAQKPVLESFEGAFKEYERLMQIVNPCLSMDPSSFGADQYLKMRKGSWVIDAARKAVRQIASQPLLYEFEPSFTEHKSIVAIIDPCMSMDSTHFSEVEFVELRKGSRLIASMTETVKKNAEMPLLETFEASMNEYKAMMGIIQACEEVSPGSFSSAEFMQLRNYSRIFRAMAQRIRDICEQPFKTTFTEALSEYNESMEKFIKPALALDLTAFGDEFDEFIKHARVFKSMEFQIKVVLALPLKTSFKECMLEYSTIMNDIMKPCMELNVDAFGGAFDDIVQYSRVYESMSVQIRLMKELPLPETFEIAMAEYTKMMFEYISPCTNLNASAFNDEFNDLIQHSRTFSAMAIQVRKFRDMPLHDTFQKAYEEYESMVNSFIQPCLSINTEAFGSEFKDLLDYQRVFDACAVQIRAIAAQELEATFADAMSTHDRIMLGFLEPCLKLNANAFGSEFNELREYQRVFQAMSIQIEALAKQPLESTFADSMKAHNNIMENFLEPCLKLNPNAFGDTFTELRAYKRIFEAMQIQVRALASQPLEDTFDGALAAHANLMDNYLTPCLQLDPNAFGTEFDDLRAHKRVFDAMAIQIRALAAQPLEETFEACMHTHNRILAEFLEPCLKINSSAFGDEFKGLIAHERVVKAMAIAVRNIAELPLVEDFKAAMEEYRNMMDHVINPVLALVPEAFGQEFDSLVAYSRVVAGGEKALRKAMELPTSSDSATAMAEFSEMHKTVAQYLALVPDSFSGEDLLSVRRGVRLEPCCEAAIGRDKLSTADEYERVVKFCAPYKAADSLAFAGEHVQRLTLLHQTIPAMRAAKQELIESAEAWDLARLREALAVNGQLSAEWGPFCESGVDTANACVASLERELELVANLEAAAATGAPTGEPGSVAPPEVAALAAAVEAAQAHTFHTPDGLHKRLQATWQLRLRQEFVTALASGAVASAPVWRTVDATLDEGFRDPVLMAETPEFTLVREDLILRGGVDATLEKLDAASAVLDAAALGSALTASQRWNMSTHPDASVRDRTATADALHVRLVACIDGLAAATASLEVAQLEAALAEAASLGFGAVAAETGSAPAVQGVEVVAAARTLLDRVVTLEQNLRDASTNMQESALKAALADAASLGYGVEGAGVAGVDSIKAIKLLLERVQKCQILLKDSTACMERERLEAAIADALSFGFGQASQVAGFEELKATEELLKRVIACEAALGSSTASLREVEIRAAVADAASFGYGDANAQPPVAGVAVVEAAKALLERVINCQNGLAAARASMHDHQLKAAIDEAASFGFGNSEASPPVAGVEEVAGAEDLLQRVLACQEALKKGLATMQASELEAAIADAASFGFGQDGGDPPVAGVALVAEAKALLDRVVKCEEALRDATALQSALQLKEALQDAKSFGYGQDESVAGVAVVTAATELLQQVLHVEKGLRDAQATMDAQALTTVLEEARGLGYGQKEPVSGVAEVAAATDLLAKVNACQEQLEQSLVSMSEDDLQTATDLAASFGFGQKDATPPVAGVETVQKATALLRRVRACQTALREAQVSMLDTQLRAAIEEANDFGFSQAVAGETSVATASALLERIVACQLQLTNGMETMHVETLKTGLSEAGAFGFDVAPSAGVRLVKDAEALLEKVIACEAALHASFKSMDDQELCNAITSAKAFGYGNLQRAEDGSSPVVAGVDLLQGAEKLLASVETSQKDLREALACMDEFKLQMSIEAARSFGYHQAPAGIEICGQVEKLLNHVVAVNKALAEASAAFDATRLEAAIADAVSIGYDGPSSTVAGAAPVAKARDLLERVQTCEAQLEAATSSLVASELEAALAGAIELGCGQAPAAGKSAPAAGSSSAICGVAEVARAKDVLERVEAIEAGLREGLETMDAPLLESLLADAKALGYGVAPRAGVELVQEATALLAKIKACFDALTTSALALDVTALKEALALASELGLMDASDSGSGSAAEVAQAQKALQMVEDIESNLNAADSAAEVNQQALAAAVKEAEGSGWGAPGKAGESAVVAAKAHLEAIERVLKEAEALVETVGDKDQLEACLATAAKQRVSTEPPVVQVQELADLPLDELLTKQMKCARAANDTERIKKLTTAIKTCFFEAHGGCFTLAAYKWARHPNDYGASRSFGVTLDPKLAAEMGIYSKQQIPTTLTTRWFEYAPKPNSEGQHGSKGATSASSPSPPPPPPPTLSKEERDATKERHKLAVRLNKNILGYMGDKQLQYPAMLARELLKAGYDQPELRDELYCQVMKQLTSNADPLSCEHGFTLLGIMLSTFPPSEELENYVEMFLREKREEDLIKKLHMIVYGAPVPGVPRMNQLDGLRGAKTRRFSIWGRGKTSTITTSKTGGRSGSGDAPMSYAASAAAVAAPKVRRPSSIEAAPAVPRVRKTPPRPPAAKKRESKLSTEAADGAAAGSSKKKEDEGSGSLDLDDDAGTSGGDAEAAVAAAEAAAAAEIAAAEAELAAVAEASDSDDDSLDLDADSDVDLDEGMDEQEPLPEGWVEYEAEGELFYYHEATKKTQVQRPK